LERDSERNRLKKVGKESVPSPQRREKKKFGASRESGGEIESARSRVVAACEIRLDTGKTRPGRLNARCAWETKRKREWSRFTVETEKRKGTR